MEPAYSVKEIIELRFAALTAGMAEIKQLLKEQNVNTDQRFKDIGIELDELRTQIAELQTDNARYKLILAFAATIGATLLSFGLNKIF